MFPCSFALFEHSRIPLLHPSVLEPFPAFLSILVIELLRPIFSQILLEDKQLLMLLRGGAAIVGSAFNSAIRVLIVCNWVWRE